MITLTTPASQLTRYGKTAASRLRFLGIETAGDLLRYYPIRYQDLRTIRPISQARAGDSVTLRGKIELISTRRSFRRHLLITEALLKDNSGSIPLTWFNQAYIGKILKVNDEILVAGKAEEDGYPLHLTNPLYEKVRLEQIHVGRIVPFYATTHDISQKQLRALERLVLPLAGRLPDPLPESVRSSHRLVDLERAVRQIHFPADSRSLVEARRRLQFQELFVFLLQLFSTRALVASSPAPAVPFDQPTVKRFVGSLPFTLTEDQRVAAWEILRAMERERPMNRMLEGDVGTGKTVVAAIAMVNAAHHRRQSTLMAPTEILAAQHEQTLRGFLQPQGVSVALITHTQSVCDGQPVPRAQLLKRIAEGKVTVTVGTHALLSEHIRFKQLALTVVDEQHRFGVAQRQELRTKSSSQGELMPHLLSMTATPIPRSLALTIYGDLDLSILKQLPADRPTVVTKRLGPDERDGAYRLMRDQVREHHQALVICPIIEESDRLGVRAATEEFRRLSSEVFPDLRVGLLHGKLPGKKKVEILDSFRTGRLDVLVATSVVEVGIDNPNTTLILIEGAERFGLAQLHQLRGRIGRGTAASTCLLLAESDSERVRQRLDALVQSRDGFHLAELDLKLRGPGELSGLEQSGMLDFRIATLSDLELIKEARSAAQELFQKDPTLASAPALREAISQSDVHPE